MSEKGQPQAPSQTNPDEYVDWGDDDQMDCWQCGGDGFVVSCFDKCACLDPESGCDLCTYPCDICNPKPQKP